MKNFTIIRKLHGGEINKNRTIFGPNIILSVKFGSEIDLYQHLDELREAIRAWKSMHKFLRAKVIKQDHDFFYVIDENSSVNRNLENVRFLRVEQRHQTSAADSVLEKSKISDELLYHLVFEKEISETINFEEHHEILWRLTLVELKNEVNRGGQFTYEMFWFVHHSIVDGLSAKENMLLLLNLIKKTIRGEKIEQTDFGVYPGTETIFEHEIRKQDPSRVEKQPARMPDFIDPAQAKRRSSEILDTLLGKCDVDVDDFELVDLNGPRKIYATLSKLVKFSREISHLKTNKITINQDDFLKLKLKSKHENVKITSLMNTILLVALIRLYKKHNVHLDKAILWTAVGLRRFRSEDDVNKFMLGYCVGACFDYFPNIFQDVLNDSEVLLKFWSLARLNDETLTDKVANSTEKFGIKLKTKLNADEMIHHSGISNLGVVDTVEVEKDGLFTIEDISLQGHVPLTNVRFLFYCYLFTLKDKVTCSILFNSHFIDYSLIDELIFLFNDLTYKLIDD